MIRDFLLPHWCKIVGWVVMVPILVVGVMRLYEVELVEGLFPIQGPFTTLLAASMMMVAFSRERDEDEYTAFLRTKYLMLAFYIDFVFLAVTAFAITGLGYLSVWAVQTFLILGLYIVIFNISMTVVRRRRSHEE